MPGWYETQISITAPATNPGCEPISPQITGFLTYIEYDDMLILDLGTQYGITSQTTLTAEPNTDKGINPAIINAISDVTSQTTSETTPRKVNKDGQTGISAVSDVSSEGVQGDKNNNTLTVPLED